METPSEKPSLNATNFDAHIDDDSGILFKINAT